MEGTTSTEYAVSNIQWLGMNITSIAAFGCFYFIYSHSGLCIVY